MFYYHRRKSLTSVRYPLFLLHPLWAGAVLSGNDVKVKVMYATPYWDDMQVRRNALDIFDSFGVIGCEAPRYS